MKFIHITDPHFVPKGKMLYGHDPRNSLEAAIKDINQHHKDAEIAIITGDLTHWGEKEAFISLKETLLNLAIPWRLLIGNHDKREIFSEIFPSQERDENGFVQSTIEKNIGTFLLLDTALEGTHAGHYCKIRQKWLADTLDKKDGPVFIFMHHPPFKIGIPVLDNINLRKDSQRIHQILSNYTNIRHIFFGHVHRPVSGSWHGIPFSTMYGTNHQIQLDLNAEDYFPHTHEPPSYCVILIETEQTIVHLSLIHISEPTRPERSGGSGIWV